MHTENENESEVIVTQSDAVLGAGASLDDAAGNNIVIRNAEQQAIIADLERLKRDACDVVREAAQEADENESLYRQQVDWNTVTATGAERWIDDEGDLGWRVYVIGTGERANKFYAYVSGKLLNMGWDNVEVVPA